MQSSMNLAVLIAGILGVFVSAEVNVGKLLNFHFFLFNIFMLQFCKPVVVFFMEDHGAVHEIDSARNEFVPPPNSTI